MKLIASDVVASYGGGLMGHATSQSVVSGKQGELYSTATKRRGVRDGVTGRRRAAVLTPVIESLEGRALFSALTLTNGVLNMTGDVATANDMGTSLSADGLSLNVWVNKTTMSVATSAVTSIQVGGGDAGDKISLDRRMYRSATIQGGAGNDTIYGGASPDVIYGGGGADWIDSGGSDDQVYAGDGNDTIYGNWGNDKIDGGNGDDAIDGGDGVNVVVNSNGTDTVAKGTVDSSPSVVKLSLYNADTSTVISDLTNGQAIDLAKLPSKNVNVLATVGGVTQSVKFDVSGKATTDSTAGFNSANLTAAGNQTVTVTAYSGTGVGGATGVASGSYVVSLNVTDSTPVVVTPPVVLSPVTAKIAAPYGTTEMVMAGVHLNGVGSVLGAGTALSAKYAWNFGDAGSSYNTYDGFNAAHVYTAAGTYTVTLTVTDSAGNVGKATQLVTVTADTRKKIYVSKAGSDSNDGSSDVKAVATVAKALTIAGSNVEVLLRKGDTWDITGTINVYGTNVMIGAYGTGAAPVIRRGNTTLGQLISINSGSLNVTVDGIGFDALVTGNNKPDAADAVRTQGTNTVVKNCVFTNVADGINGELNPNGVLVQDVTAPNFTSVKAYFAWVQGADWVFLGNYAMNSTREHIIRVGGADRVNAEYNDFGNQWSPTDSSDIAKGVFTMQIGSYINFSYNSVWWGPVGVGPLGGVDGKNSPTAKSQWVVLRGNTITGAGMNISPGAEHVMYEDNAVTNNGTSVFTLTATDSTKDSAGNLIYPTRNLLDINIKNNTGFNNSNNGRFLTLQQASNAGQINLINNLYVAPKLETGYNQNAVLYVAATDLGSFGTISGNIWPVPAKSPSSSGAEMYVQTYWWDPNGYITPSAWLLKSNVKGDVFAKITISDTTVGAASTTDSYSVTSGGVTAGARIIRE